MKTVRGLREIVLCCVAVFMVVAGSAQASPQTFTFSGEIADVSGKPVSGAEVSFYKTNNVKKPADFVSSRTGENGNYQVVLPQGAYWAFATFRKDGKKFGPLGLEDKHSGEAVEVSVGPDDELLLDFVIMDLREAAKRVQKKNDTLIRFSGRIVDLKGRPVKMAYAMADTVKRVKKIPKYLSAWTDESGQYLLFMPAGRYFFGASAGFPPDADYSLSYELLIDKNQAGVDLALPSK